MRINITEPQSRQGGPAHLRFAAGDKVRKTSDIRRLIKPGRRREKTKTLVLSSATSLVSRPRIGVVVPKHGYNSVQRNLVKRRLREISRTSLLPRLREHNEQLDVLIQAKRQAYESPFARLEREAVDALEKICSNG